MKKIIRGICLALILAFGVAPAAQAVRILEIEFIDPVVFRDNVANGDISNMEVFIPAGKTWSADASGLRCSSDDTWLWSGIAAKVEDKYVRDCIISADFTWKDRFDSSGIFFRGVDDTLLYNTHIMIDNGAPKLLFHKRYHTNQWQNLTLATIPVTATVNGTSNLKVKLEGPSIQIFVDDVMVVDYIDELNPILEGKVGVHHRYGQTAINNIKIETLYKGGNDGKEEEDQMAMFYQKDEINSFSDAVYDYYGWNDGAEILHQKGTELSLIPESEDSYYTYHTAGYAKKRFSEEPITFQAKSPLENYFGVSFKNKEPGRISNAENDGYIFKVYKDKLILEKWLSGKCTALAEAENSAVMPDEYSTYSITQQETEEGLEIAAAINGQEVIKETDKENYILGESYISVVSYEKELKLQGDPNIEKTLKQMLGTTIAFLKGSSKVYAGGNLANISDADKTLAVYEKSGNIMLPVRSLGVALGANVSWNDQIKQAIVKYEPNTFGINGGYADYFKNNERTALSGVCENIGGTMFAPMDFYLTNFPVDAKTTEEGLILISDNPENLETIAGNKELLAEIISVLKAD